MYLVLLFICFVLSTFLFIYSFIGSYGVYLDGMTASDRSYFYEYRLIDMLKDASALLSFIFSIIVLLLLLFLVIYVITGKYKESKTMLLVLTIITFIADLVLTICIQVFTNKAYPEIYQNYVRINGVVYYSITMYGYDIMLAYCISAWLTLILLSINIVVVFVNSFANNDLKSKKFFCISIFKSNNKPERKKEDSVLNQHVFSEESVNLLLKLNELLKSGIITQEEFDKKKKEILG